LPESAALDGTNAGAIKPIIKTNRATSDVITRISSAVYPAPAL